jgi:hypothetical protein
VTTENLTKSRGDLCAAFNRSIGHLRNPNALGAGSFEIRVRLSRLVTSPEVFCNLGISVSSRSVGLGVANGGAKVAKPANVAGSDRFDRLATRDCIDAVLEDLMTRVIGPLMQQHVASRGSNPTSPSPTPPWLAP